jgi:hypothetical protein
MKYIFIITVLFCFGRPFVCNAQLDWIIEPVIDHDNFSYYPNHNESYIIIKPEVGKAGVINREGEIMLHPDSFVNIIIFESNGLWKGFKNDRTVAYFNNDLDYISGDYDALNSFYRTNILMVQQNKLFGLIDSSGEVIKVPQYTNLRRIKRGIYEGTLPDKKVEIIRVQESNGKSAHQNRKSLKILSEQLKDRIMMSAPSDKRNFRYWGFTDLKGDTLLRPDRYYSNFGKMHYEQQFMIAIDGVSDKAGVIDKDGSILIPFVYDKINPALFADRFFIAQKEEKFGVLNRNNEVVLPFEYEMLFPVPEGDVLIAQKDGKKGVINITFEEVLPFEYDKVDIFKPLVLKIQKKGKIGFYAIPTQKHTPVQFSKVIFFGKPAYGVTYFENFALFDTYSGKFLTDTIFTEITRKGAYYEAASFHFDTVQMDTTSILLKRRDYMVLDTLGKVVFESDKPVVYLMDDLFVQRTEKNDTVFIYDLKTNARSIFEGGDMVFKRDETFYAEHRITQIQKNVYAFTDEIMTNDFTVYEYIGPPKDHLRVYKKNGKFGLLHQRIPVTPPLYDEIKHINNGMIKAKFNGKWGVLENPFYREH